MFQGINSQIFSTFSHEITYIGINFLSVSRSWDYRGWFGENAVFYVKRSKKGDEKPGRWLKARLYFCNRWFRFLICRRVFRRILCKTHRESWSKARLRFDCFFCFIQNRKNEKRSCVFHRAFHQDVLLTKIASLAVILLKNKNYSDFCWYVHRSCFYFSRVRFDFTLRLTWMSIFLTRVSFLARLKT